TRALPSTSQIASARSCSFTLKNGLVRNRTCFASSQVGGCRLAPEPHTFESIVWGSAANAADARLVAISERLVRRSTGFLHRFAPAVGLALHELGEFARRAG